MGRRLSPRVEIKLPVRVSGVDAEGNRFTRLAETVDVSTTGARLSGIYLRLAAGSVVELERNSQKARFRVAWTGKPGTEHAGQVGLVCLDSAAHLWGIALPGANKDDYEPQPPRQERRRHCRFNCNLGVEVSRGSGPATHVKCMDIGGGGCYLETWSPLPIGTKLVLLLRLPDGNVFANGEVRSMDPGFGMGVAFVTIDNPEVLERYVREQTPAAASQLGSQLECDPPEAQQAGTTESDTDNVSDQSLAPYRVLLADDSKFLRSAYSMYLRREGYHVIIADDGEQALQLASSERPDVIILDLLMPKIGGVAALTVLKQNRETATIPVIVLSGLPSSNGDKLRAIGAFAYVAKTQVGPEELPQFVVRALQGGGSGYLARTRGMNRTFASA